MWRSGGIAPPYLTSALDGERSAPRPSLFTHHGKFSPVVIRYVAKWDPESVLTLRNREKSLAFAGNRTLAVQLIVYRYVYRAIPTQGDETIKLRLLLDRCAVRRGREWNWFMIVCNSKQGSFFFL
jgi:hypothetical protein